MPNIKKTEIWSELLKMKPIKVKLEQVYLDPNNPRVEVPMKKKVPEDRIYEKGIQEGCLEKLKEGIIDYESTAREIGKRILENSEIVEKYRETKQTGRENCLLSRSKSYENC